MPNRWPFKVHYKIFQAHTRTQSFPSDQLTVITRMALPPDVNERCVATMEGIIKNVWFKSTEPITNLFSDRQHPMMLGVEEATDLQFTSGLIRRGIVSSVAFEASRLDPVIGPQDPDFGYGSEALDPEMRVRLFRAVCDLDNEVRQSDAEIGIERW